MMAKKMSRRSFLEKSIMAGVGVLGGSLSLNRKAYAAAKPEIIIGFDGGSWQEFLDQIFSQPFAKQYNCEISYDIGTELDRITKLIAEKSQPTVCCSKLDTTDIDKCIDLGIVEKMDPKNVPNLKDIAGAFKNDYWAANIVATFGLVYNTEKIKEGITSWWDLWNPKYKGKVGIPVYEWMGEAFLPIINFLTGGTPKNLDPGVRKLREYVKEMTPIFISNTDHGIQLFTRGELWAAPFWDGRARNLQDNKVPVKFVFPKEGAAPLGYGLALNKAIKVRELTEKYINYTLDPEKLIPYCRLTKYPPTNLKAMEKLPPDLERIKIPREAMDNMLRIDYYGYSKITDNALERWNKEIATAG
jgi:putative spermidine/putrescine transport system substrate-binding protein